MKAMTGTLIGNLVNIILDPIMILGFKWYVAGAAIATVFGNLCSAGFYIYHILKKSDLLSIRLSDYSVGNGIASGIFAIGIPASLNFKTRGISVGTPGLKTTISRLSNTVGSFFLLILWV